MAKNANNIKIGQCDAYFDKSDGAGERDLGHTLGGCEINYEPEFQDLTVDKYGNTPVDKALIGEKVTVKVILAEATLENLDLAIPSGVYNENGSDSKLEMGRDAGHRLADSAGILRLHPVENASDDRDEDFYLFKAVAMEPVPQIYKIDEQRTIEITFIGFVDESKEDGGRLARFGDIDIS